MRFFFFGLCCSVLTLNGATIFPPVSSAPVAYQYGNYITFSTNQVYTNQVINGQGGFWSSTSTNVTIPLFDLQGSVAINNLTMTNTSNTNAGNTLIGTPPSTSNLTYVQFNNDYFYGQRLAFGLQGSVNKTIIIDARSCYFFGKAEAMETWWTSGRFVGCTFVGAGPQISGVSSVNTYVANDKATNTFLGCDFYAYGGAVDNECVVAFDSAKSTFNGCNFFIAPTSGSTDQAIYVFENNVTMTFNNCYFDLAYTNTRTALLLNIDPSATVPLITFNNCTYTPITNGVVIVNGNLPVTVRGGNLKAANFDHPENVIWLDTLTSTNLASVNQATPAFTIVNTNFIQGVIYSNFYNAPIQVNANIRLTTAAVAGDATMDFQQPAGTLRNRVGLQTTASSLAITNEVNLIGFVPVNGTYTVTNTLTTGSGNAVFVIGGQLIVY